MDLNEFNISKSAAFSLQKITSNLLRINLQSKLRFNNAWPLEGAWLKHLHTNISLYHWFLKKQHFWGSRPPQHPAGREWKWLQCQAELRHIRRWRRHSLCHRHCATSKKDFALYCSSYNFYCSFLLSVMINLKYNWNRSNVTSLMVMLITTLFLESHNFVLEDGTTFSAVFEQILCWHFKYHWTYMYIKDSQSSLGSLW